MEKSSCGCETPALASEQIALELKTLAPNWQLREHRLVRRYVFPDFKAALAFTNRVGALAEQANHHPDLWLGWGKVEIHLWTHSANGLTLEDFKLARRIELDWEQSRGSGG